MRLRLDVPKAGTLGELANVGVAFILVTAIERIAYPRFKPHPSAKELADLYTPTSEEMQFVQSQVRTKSGLLRMMVMLKSFQRLGYFSRPEFVPAPVITHLRSCLQLNSWISAIPTLPSRYRYQQAIRDYLGVKPYSHASQKLAAEAIATVAEIKDHPADLIMWPLKPWSKSVMNCPPSAPWSA